MTSESENIDDAIVRGMNLLNQLVEKQVEWIEKQGDLNDYSWGLTVFESNLKLHADKMLAFQERIIKQIAEKCGSDGKEIYGKALKNVRIRRFFAKVAEYFTHKFPE